MSRRRNEVEVRLTEIPAVPRMSLPVESVGWLAFHALNHLPDNEDDDGPRLLDADGTPKWCCRNCCGACLGLFQLREMGLLDKLLASTGKAHGWSWWDTDLQTVKAGYLDNIAVRCEQCTDEDERS